MHSGIYEDGDYLWLGLTEEELLSIFSITYSKYLDLVIENSSDEDKKKLRCFLKELQKAVERWGMETDKQLP